MRIIGGIISFGTIGFFLIVAAIGAYSALSIAVPMVTQSWASHQANVSRHQKTEVSFWDNPENRARFGAAACEDYKRGNFVSKMILPFYRDLAWCADRKA